ncbi:unnamed protein product, partial [Ilex paraguariensis]
VRNNWVYQNQHPNSKGVINQALLATSEFQQIDAEPATQTESQHMNTTWSPPLVGFTKINCEASFLAKTRIRAYATLVRNCENRLMNGASASIIVPSPLAANASIIMRAYRMALEEAYNLVIIESDSKELIKFLVQGPTTIIREIKFIQLDIWAYANQLPAIKYSYAKRECNTTTHVVAK